ncbi:MAG: hypothetical protein NVS2B17_31550 [Candidatus Velthaea sp.]
MAKISQRSLCEPGNNTIAVLILLSPDRTKAFVLGLFLLAALCAGVSPQADAAQVRRVWPLASPSAVSEQTRAMGSVSSEQKPWYYNLLLGSIGGGLVGALAKAAWDEWTRKREIAETNCRILWLMFDEINGHQASLCRFIDEVLPDWLRRSEGFDLSKAMPPRLSDDIYREFRAQLLHSDLLVLVVSHYKAVANINTLTNPEVQRNDYWSHNAMRDCSSCLNASVQLSDEILAQRGMARYRQGKTRSLVKNYESIRSRYHWLYLLSAADWHQLAELATYLNLESISNGQNVDIEARIQTSGGPQTFVWPISEIYTSIKAGASSAREVEALAYGGWSNRAP